MRIYFRAMTLPKKAAKRVRKHFSSNLSADSMKLSQAQNLTARMLGYDHWHELEQITKNNRGITSKLDEDCSDQEQIERIDYQARVLGTVSPLIEPVLRQVALKLRVSAGFVSSDNLIEDAHRNGVIRPWVVSDEEEVKWRYIPSIRSEDIIEELDALLHEWQEKNVHFVHYINELMDYLLKQPENITIMSHIMAAALEEGEVEYIVDILESFEQEVEFIVPKGFPSRKKTIISWGEIDNREFHRTVVLLAECFYQIGRFNKAKRWFNFSNRTCDRFTNHIAPFLEDLRKTTPKGTVCREI